MKKKGGFLNSKKTFVGPSKIHGNGVIAKKNIKKGEIIFVIKGELLHWNPDIPQPKNSEMWVGIDRNIWIDPHGVTRYLNHSSNPNSGIRGRVVLRAIKNIKRGEEITIDYSTTEEYTPWKMKDCKGEGERKFVRSIQFLPLKTYQKYLPYIPYYFQKVYNKYHNLKQKNG